MHLKYKDDQTVEAYLIDGTEAQAQHIVETQGNHFSVNRDRQGKYMNLCVSTPNGTLFAKQGEWLIIDNWGDIFILSEEAKNRAFEDLVLENSEATQRFVEADTES